jgi:hypothetical protein
MSLFSPHTDTSPAVQGKCGSAMTGIGRPTHQRRTPDATTLNTTRSIRQTQSWVSYRDGDAVDLVHGAERNCVGVRTTMRNCRRDSGRHPRPRSTPDSFRPGAPPVQSREVRCMLTANVIIIFLMPPMIIMFSEDRYNRP